MMNKLNYLIFDDHPLVCIAIKSLVESLGTANDVLTVTNSKDALKILKEQQIGLLILDVNLADCDGYDFYKRINRTVLQESDLLFCGDESYV